MLVENLITRSRRTEERSNLDRQTSASESGEAARMLC